MISVIDMPATDESVWWRGKRGFEVGFFPCDCVEIIGDKVPHSLNLTGTRLDTSFRFMIVIHSFICIICNFIINIRSFDIIIIIIYIIICIMESFFIIIYSFISLLTALLQSFKAQNSSNCWFKIIYYGFRTIFYSFKTIF